MTEFTTIFDRTHELHYERITGAGACPSSNLERKKRKFAYDAVPPLSCKIAGRIGLCRNGSAL
jgi:hypothetical protein